MNTAISALRQAHQEMQDVVQSVEQCMSMLKASPWDSPGKERFFSDYTESWKTSFAVRMEALREMGDKLQTAYDAYAELYEAIPRLADKLQV